MLQTHPRNSPQASKRYQCKRQVRILQSLRRITWLPRPSAHWCAIRAHLTHSHCLPNSPGSAHYPIQHNYPRGFQHVDFSHLESVSVSRSGSSIASSRATMFCHGQGIVPRGYPQPDKKLNQWHRSGRSNSPPIQLQPVDVSRASRVQGNFQEDNLPSSRSDSDFILCRQITSRVRWHHQNVV